MQLNKIMKILRHPQIFQRIRGCIVVLLLTTVLICNAFYVEAKELSRQLVGVTIINNELKFEVNQENAEKVLYTASLVGKQDEWSIMSDPKPKRGFPQYAGEIQTLAIIIEEEAGKTMEDRIFTGSVVINRAEVSADNEDFGGLLNIWEVVHQRGQYYSDTVHAVDEGRNASPEAWYVARGLIEGTIPCLEECVVYQMDEQPGGKFGASLVYVQLPGSCQYYAIPRDFYGDDRYDGVYSTTSEVYPMDK